MNAHLIISAAGIAVYAVLFVFYGVRISAEKKRRRTQGASVPKPSASFAGSLALCALTELLPFLIPLKLYVTAVVCLCGILGETLVLKERLQSLRP